MQTQKTGAGAYRAALIICLMLAGAGPARGQATRTPAFQAPARAFARYEFGATGSTVGFDYLGIEGVGRVAAGRFDIGVRGGFIDRGDIPGSTGVLGVEVRVRVLQHAAALPLDAALVLGAGTAEFDALFVPVGISLGRRLDLPGASVVLYAQPTAALLQGADDVDGNRTVQVGLGIGADLRLGRALDLRTSVGFFDYGNGLAVSCVWVR
jgi:hypothetical protein